MKVSDSRVRFAVFQFYELERCVTLLTLQQA